MKNKFGVMIILICILWGTSGCCNEVNNTWEITYPKEYVIIETSINIHTLVSTNLELTKSVDDANDAMIWINIIYKYQGKQYLVEIHTDGDSIGSTTNNTNLYWIPRKIELVPSNTKEFKLKELEGD